MKRAALVVGAIVASLAMMTSTEASWRDTPGMYAVFETNHGTIVAQLFPDKAPKTVENFVGLAEATKPYKDPNLGEMVKRHFYDGTSFHRIIPGFMMQGGDPLGTGTGGPGYTIEDEFAPDLKFDIPGRLAMARTSRPNSAGSQFFITQKPTEWLNGKHTIFGQVVEGMDVVDKVCTTLGSQSGAPKEPVTIKKLTIERIKAKAK